MFQSAVDLQHLVRLQGGEVRGGGGHAGGRGGQQRLRQPLEPAAGLEAALLFTITRKRCVRYILISLPGYPGRVCMCIIYIHPKFTSAVTVLSGNKHTPRLSHL